MTADYRWSPLADLPENLGGLSDGELAPLIEVWKEQRNSLTDTSSVEEFSKRLSREWAIETGIIEGAYTLDRGVTQTLIEQGIDAALISHDATDRDPAEVAAMINDHLEAVDALFEFVKRNRELTIGYIKELHALLMRHVHTHRVQNQFGQFFDKELEKGVYKTSPNNPRRNGHTHEYCPPEQVAPEMERLVALHRVHERRDVPPEIQAAWLHHAFTQIHPFADGNGRVARTLATLVLIRAGSFPLVVRRLDRSAYIEALETADLGNLANLVTLFVRSQRRVLLGGIHALPAISNSQAEDTGLDTVEGAIEAARETLLSKGAIGRTEWERAKGLGRQLYGRLNGRIENVTAMLQQEIGAFAHGGQFVSEEAAPTFVQLAEIAKAFGYDVSEAEWHRARGIRLRQDARVMVSLHAVGKKYRGVIAGLVLFAQGTMPPSVASEDMFQTNYKDQPEAAERRFAAWLERGLARAIGRWRETL